MQKLVVVKWIDSGLCDPGWVEAKSYEKKTYANMLFSRLVV